MHRPPSDFPAASRKRGRRPAILGSPFLQREGKKYILGSPFLHREGGQGVRFFAPPPATTEPDLLSQVQGLAPNSPFLVREGSGPSPVILRERLGEGSATRLEDTFLGSPFLHREGGKGVRFLYRKSLASLALTISLALSACGTMQQSTTYYPLTDKTAPAGKNVLDVPLEKFTADLVTPAGFKVKTNGQYKTEAQTKAAAAAIDRYWTEIRDCSTTALKTSGTADAQPLLAEFPTHLSIEIANTWKVVEGPTTHRRMQAFPSLARPGGWSTARREEDELYILVVPELNGLGPQMAGELNLWLSRQTTLLTDVASTCSSVPCLRFAYNNTPSQAWNECK
jgi:hypothetical protein